MHTFDDSNTCTVCGYDAELVDSIQDNDDQIEDAGLPTYAIILLVIGSIVAVGGACFCVYWFVIRKKSQVMINESENELENESKINEDAFEEKQKEDQ